MPERIEQCVRAIEGRDGVDDAYALCTWMDQHGYDLPASREDSVPNDAVAAFRSQQDADGVDQSKKDPDQSRKVGPGAPDPGDVPRARVPRAEANALAFRYSTPFTAEIAPEGGGPVQRAFPKARTLRLKGTFIDLSVNDNRWGVPAPELVNIARQLASGTVQVRVDHRDEVGKVVGVYDGATLLDAPAPRPGEEDLAQVIPLDAPEDELARAKRVDFTARMTTEDSGIMVPVLMGYVKGVSPNLFAEHVECGVCGKPAYPMPACAHFDSPDDPGWHLLRNVRVKEGSIVATPAYQNTPFLPVGFAAGLDQKTKELRSMAEAQAAAQASRTGADERLALMQDRLALEQERRAAAEERNKSYEARLAVLERRFLAQSDEDDDHKKKAKKAESEDDDHEAAAEDDDKAEYEDEEKKTAKKAATASRTRPPTLEERVAATRQGAKASADAKTEATSTPFKRPWGAMAGSLHSDTGYKADQVAFAEIREAVAGKRPLGRFGRGIDDIASGGEVA